MGLPGAAHAPFSGLHQSWGNLQATNEYFGLRASESAREIEIRWLSGFHRIIRDVKADQSVIETQSAKVFPRVARGLESFVRRICYDKQPTAIRTNVRIAGRSNVDGYHASLWPGRDYGGAAQCCTVYCRWKSGKRGA